MTPLAVRGVSQTRGAGRRAVHVLHDVSLEVEPGEFVILEGPSGSGKTTLLAVAAGLLTPDTGDVVLGGTNVTAASPAGRRALRAKMVGFVFQRSNLLGELTARQNVLVMARLAGMSRAEAASEADRLLAELGVAGLGHRYPRELSGGEEQRVAVARALVHRPALVLADEPTSSLDGATGLAVVEALARLARERDSAVLVSTFDPRLARTATRRLAILDGRLSSRVLPGGAS
jgi:putative ABC transport system ATP-binding protein